jgi:hypothetical protein
LAMAFSIIVASLFLSPSRQAAKNATTASKRVDSTGRLDR